jgi:hypothetical protein
MYKHHRPAPLKLREDGLEASIPEIDPVCVGLQRRASERARVVPDVDPRGRDRSHRYIDASLVHEGQHQAGVPWRRRDPADRTMGVVGLAPEEVRQDVVVNIDGEGHSRASSFGVGRCET